MVFNMITLKSTNIKFIITTCFLILLVQYTIGWNNKRYILWLTTLPMLSLSALLGLNTVVLYIYLKYFVSPHARKKVDSFKPLRFTHKSIWPRLEQLRQLDNTPSETAFSSLTNGQDPDIEAAFNQLLQYVIRDFISSWFIKISGQLSEQSFPIAVDHIIRSAAANVSTRLQKTDLLFVTINKIIPKMTVHISEFRTAETSLRGKSLERSVTQSDELDLLLASRFRHGKLHPALTTAAVTTKPTEIAYLRHLIERVLPLVIEKKELASGPVRVVIREIVSNSVLQPVLDMLADPDFWNQTIDTYLGKAIIEQKMVRQLREVLNRHSTNEIDEEEVMNVFKSNDPTPTKKSAKTTKSRPRMKMGPKTQLSSAYLGTGVLTTTEDDDGYNDDDEGEGGEEVKDRPFNTKLKEAEDDLFFFQQPLSQQRKKRFGVGYGGNSVKMGKRTYQDFLKLINEEKNLLDLKRVRNDLVTQIRKKKAHIAERDPEEVMDGEKVEDIIVYINRLSTAKKRVDKRIATLSGEQFDFRKSTSQLFGVGYGNSSRKQSTTSHIGIGYSLQDILTNTSGLSYFMEFMDRRGDMVKLQFWLIVEGFHSTDITTPHEQKTFLQDVKMVYDMYFTDFAPHRLHLASEQLNTDLKASIKLAEENSSKDEVKFADSIRELRLRLYRIQQHVFWEIEKEHYPYFKRSDLYFKFLASAPPITSTDTKTTSALTAAIPEDEVMPAPARRSLDESTLYNHSISRQPSIHTPRPASIHESTLNVTSTSSSPMTATATTIEESNKVDKKADSDSELPSSSSNKPHRPMTLKLSVSDYGRLRGHQRALSDSTKTAPSSSRFLSFSNMFAWNNNNEEKRQSSSSVPTSIKSLELTTEDETSMDKSSILEDEEAEEEIRKSNRLVKSNTVDAVEAELRSILDGKNSHNGNDDLVMAPSTTKEEQQQTSTVVEEIKAPKPQSTKSLPSLLLKPSSSSSALLLCGNKGIKSSTAVPVQNAYALPSWTSSGGTNTISEIEHDSLESLVSSTTPASKSTPSPKPSSITPAIPEDEVLDTTTTGDNATAGNIHFAPPGDLMLAAKVAQLTEEIEKLSAQEAIVDALIAKAESQNKLEELRILKKSKSMFRQELQQIQYQKSQYQLQESENVLHPERSKVNITSATIGSDKHGDFALYVIEIQQLGFDGNYASGWIVARRYSEFFALHTKLKEIYPIVKLIEFPAKWPLLKLQKPFVEARRISLERYLRRLMEEKEICSSQELRAFLSQQNIFVPGPSSSNNDGGGGGGEWMGGLFGTASNPAVTSSVPLRTSSSSSSLHSLTSPSIQNLQKSMASAGVVPSATGVSTLNHGEQQPKGFMRHIYKTVAAGIDDILIGPSMLDLITQRLGEQVMEFSTTTSPPASSTSSSSQRLTDSIVATTNDHSATLATSPATGTTPTTTTTENIPDSLKAEGITRFTEPLCDLFIEMFELKDKTNWLRRQAVVIILQQILEGTIERKLKESIKWLSSSSMVVFYFNKITSSLWPDGGPLTFKEARKPEEKQTTREEANRKLSTWLPDLLGNMVGRQNARKGARRLFTVLQNKRLNQDLVYTLLDEVIFALFPELLEPSSSNNASYSFVK